ncbi:MAG: hypothetical protein EBS38_02810 [Actinobacteria bacterium]|nr:hypothetical protein [Actinomycetota bacterium]
MRFSKRAAIATTAALSLIGTLAAPSSAHVSIVPGVSAAGNTTDALTVGRNNTINFRVGHGCSLEKDIIHPKTGKIVATAALDKFDTLAFSVTVPVTALGETGSTMPRPEFVPGWRTTSKKNADGTVTVKWRAISDDFALPNGPEGDTGATMFYDFGLRVAFSNATRGQRVSFVAQQTCLVDIPKARGFKAGRLPVYETWDGTPDGADTVLDNNGRGPAPSVTVNP